MSALIRPMVESDIPAVVALQRACFPAPFPVELLWQEDQLAKHLSVFPEGQFVFESESQVKASSSSTRISEENWQAHGCWTVTVGGPYLDTYDVDGSTLYGLDISVHPCCRGIGVGRAMYEARFNLVRQLELTRFGTACRIPDLSLSLANGTSSHAKDYVSNVDSGKLTDRTLTPLLRYGLRVIGVIADYMDDPESHNYAASLEWMP